MIQEVVKSILERDGEGRKEGDRIPNRSNSAEENKDLLDILRSNNKFHQGEEIDDSLNENVEPQQQKKVNIYRSYIIYLFHLIFIVILIGLVITLKGKNDLLLQEKEILQLENQKLIE